MPEFHHTITSQNLENERSLWVRVPDTPPANLDLLVILDAELYRNRVQSPKILDTLFEDETLTNLLVVHVSAVNMETRFTECPCHPPFAYFIAQELIPWIHDNYPATQRANRRVITGLSYTGLAASFAALKHDSLFTHVISQSGSYWSNDCWLTKEFDGVQPPSPPAFFLDVGDQEIQTNVWHREDLIQPISQIEGVERFRDMLERNGYNVRFDIFQGNHSAEDWAQSLPNALKWAFA
ncbi:alpha/beta hydrolase [Pelagicoccus mobilis]|uniref:Esterase family protein n=1 Tax=Pelagicoccus mobilis TaxID=415221 RepID=A0A934VKH3_9BACT|nr:alpha/beta hydrolase-fold protein [Pelagicoccus mobilis]MBK1876681.1 esterase family protein [Pelagicoccus mobilis]